MTEKSAASKSKAAEEEARTLDIRDCEICHRPTALPACPACGFDPEAAAKAKADAEGD